MSTSLLLALLGGLFFIFIWIGKYCADAYSTKAEYYVGQRSMGVFSLTMTFFAAQIGGGAVLGSAEEAFRYGWIAYAYPMGLVLGMLLLASGPGEQLRKYEIFTVSEVFVKIYQSKLMRMLSSLIFSLSLFLILVAQCVASRKFLSALGYPQTIFFFVVWGIMVFYTSIGGLKGVILTDILQGIVKLSAMLALAMTLWFLPDTSIEIKTIVQEESPPWIDWLLLPPLFLLIAQDMGQRCFAAKSAKTVTYAAILSAALFAVISIIPIYVGILARKYGISPEQGNSIFLTVAMVLTNPYVAALSACGVLMAIVSIANSLLCSLSSQLSYDFFTYESMRYSKAITATIGISAAVLSYCFENVFELLVLSYELTVSMLFIPIFMILVKKPLKLNEAWGCIIIGGMCYGLAVACNVFASKSLLSLLCCLLFLLSWRFYVLSRKVYQRNWH